VEDDSDEMKNYVFQMQVYSELYKKRHGDYPSRAIICFLGEKELEKMIVSVPLGSTAAKDAVELFARTVDEIESRKDRDDWSPPSTMPSIETCSACDIRWDCSAAKYSFPLRRP
jgi:glutathionyl-hydroquinone reductase